MKRAWGRTGESFMDWDARVFKMRREMEDIGSGKEKIGERGVRGKERGENSRGQGKCGATV